MARSGEIEFGVDLVADPASGWDEDVVDLGRARYPRWFVVGVACATAAIVGFAVQRAERPHHPRADPGVATPMTSADIGRPVHIGTAPAVDVAVFGNRVYVLQFGRLSAIDPRTKRIVAHAAVGSVDDGDALHIAADAARNRIWVVGIGVQPAPITEFDARSLHRLRSAVWPNPIGSVTVLDGDLYFAGGGIDVWRSGDERPVAVAALAHEQGPMAADPSRHRLLLLDLGQPTQIFAYSATAGVGPRVDLPVGKAEVVVVHGRIWLVGFAVTGGAVFAPIDATTLEEGVDTDVSVDLQLGAIPAAVGQDVVWLRNGSGTNSMWCVDAETGAVYKSWANAPGQVASAAGAAYLATGTQLVELAMGTCPG